jgi:hypothetical protein
MLLTDKDGKGSRKSVPIRQRFKKIPRIVPDKNAAKFQKRIPNRQIKKKFLK